MPQEDKFKREIDRIGLMLAKLLSTLLQKPFNYSNTYDYFAQQLKSEVDIDLEEFLEMKDGDDVRLLVDDKRFSIGHLRDFGNMLYGLAEKTDDEEKRKQLRDKALHVYEHINANSKGTLYLDVEYRIKELQGLS